MAWIGCGSRAIVGSDGAAGDDAGSGDAQPQLCTGFSKAAQLTLDYADTTKTAPTIAFDGERFAVLWHSQPAPVSSLIGELRFTLVDSKGKPSFADGLKVADDDGAMEAALLAQPTEYAVLHRPTNGGGGTLLRRFNYTGKTYLTNPVGASHTRASLAPHAAGFAMLLAGPGSSPRVMVLDGTKGSITASSYITTAEGIATTWLARRSGGYAAALHSANANATLYMLDSKLTEVGRASVGHGSPVRSPAFATLAGGYAVVFGNGKGGVEVARFDASGKDKGHKALGTTGFTGAATHKIGAVWTGKQLVAGFPSAVPGQFVLQLADAAGAATGGQIELPRCLAVSSSISMAWGRQVLAVASLDAASGVAKSCVCVTLLRCP
jgi:hypothetical protein